MDHKFQVNLRGIIDLLSNHLYAGPEVFVRELLQNGVDAVRARAKRGDFAEGDGQVSLDVAHPPGKRPTLTAADNGVGLTEEEVHRFLATIGESSKRLLGEGVPDRPTDYLGQFGIGLLACFLVSDEIVVVSRSAGGGPAVEWRGRPDGTYTLRPLAGEFEPGTQVFLTAKPGAEAFFTRDRLTELARHYGALLPYPVRVGDGRSSTVVTEGAAPWRGRFASPKARRERLLDYGRDVFNERFLDAVPLRAEAGGVDGVAFVRASSPGPAGRRADRVYLKGMLLSESAETLLPEWAFFCRVVVNSDGLRPTAARDGFHHDRKLDEARDALADALKAYLIDLAENRPDQWGQFLAVHDTALRALAAQDDDCFRVFIDHLPFDTAEGSMTLPEYRRKHDVVRYVADHDQFRQVARVAAAQGVGLIDAGFTYAADLLNKLAELDPDAAVEAVDAAAVAQQLDDVSDDDLAAAEGFLAAADAALRPFRCRAELRRFRPAALPALYSTSREGRFLRSVEQAKEVASPVWGDVLSNLGRRGDVPKAQLFLNHDNALVRRLAALGDRPVCRRAAEMLYVQALLLGHHPLDSKETALLSDGLLGLIEGNVAAEEDRRG